MLGACSQAVVHIDHRHNRQAFARRQQEAGATGHRLRRGLHRCPLRLKLGPWPLAVPDRDQPGPLPLQGHRARHGCELAVC